MTCLRWLRMRWYAPSYGISLRFFEQIMTSVADGTVSSDDFYYEGGECAQLTEFADFVPEEVQTAVADLKAKIDSGEVQIYGGELKDNEGNVLVAEGRGYAGRRRSSSRSSW